MYKNIISIFSKNIVKNSFWSTISNILQNVLLSIFFIILARQYSTLDFGNYIIANTIYSFVLGFSSLGMGHWFIREYVNSEDKISLSNRFFKMQLYVGVLFYLINILISVLLYKTLLIRYLSVIIGINIIFDNLIYVIKSLNIAEMDQKRSSILLAFEALVKFTIGLLIFIYPINIILLSFILILVRFITLNLFIQYGTRNSISLTNIFKVHFKYKQIKEIIISNWSFVVISSISVVNWRIGNILVSKILSIKDVANYEISYKLLSMFYLIPIMITTSLYPTLINAKAENNDRMKIIYCRSFVPLCIYGFLSFTFIYSYSDIIIPLLFGSKYLSTSAYCKEMFLVMLIFPTIFLQANVLLTLRLEKLDMICNIVCLILNIAISIIGLKYFKSLSVVNYAIFISFIVFHIIQDYILIKNKITDISHVVSFYLSSLTVILSYILLSKIISKEILFVFFWMILSIIYFIINKRKSILNFQVQNQ